MSDRTVKWLVYTVIIGLVPALARLLISSISLNDNVSYFNALDFIIFGLILHTANINEVEHFRDDHNNWKTIQNGTSIVFIAAYSLLFTCYLIGQSNPNTFNLMAINYIAMGIAIVSFLISFSVYNRISSSKSNRTYHD